MNASHVSATDRKLAALCLACPVCRQARRSQAGIAFWLVKKVETRLCPACRAYERVYGRKSHVAFEKGPR
jgi:hypothetical protein